MISSFYNKCWFITVVLLHRISGNVWGTLSQSPSEKENGKRIKKLKTYEYRLWFKAHEGWKFSTPFLSLDCILSETLLFVN